MNTFKATESYLKRVRSIPRLKPAESSNQGADLSQWCGPIFNQLSEGSCTACCTRDFIWWLQNKYGYQNPIDPDVQALYYFARELFGDLNEDGGSTVMDAFQGAITYGVIPSQDEAYTESTLYTPPPLQDVVFKATAMQNLSATTASIRASLDNGIPVGIAVQVMQSLFSPTLYNGMHIVDVSAVVQGEGHAVFVPKYKPDPKYGFLYGFQNSWGEEYGDDGYAWFTEAYLQQCLWEVCTLDIPHTQPYNPSPTPSPSPTPTPTPSPSPSSNYQLAVSFESASVAVGASNNLTVQTMNGTSPVGNQTVQMELVRPYGTFTPTYTTGENGIYTVPIISPEAGTITVNATWIAPDGSKQTASTSATWQSQQPTPTPSPTPSPTPTPTPNPTPTPTPQPTTTYTIQVNDEATANKIQAWAQEQGWNISLVANQS